MKQQQPIARQSAKPKRGHEFIDDNTGQLVFLYRVKSDVCYLVSTSKEYLPGDLYDAKPSDLSASRPIRLSTISSKPKALTGEAKNDKEALNEFFDQLALRIPYLCDNCHKPIGAFTKLAKRSACCHILPKSKFPSVALNPDNILYMGAIFIGGCGDHDKWDNSIESRIKMPVYSLALEKFELFKHLLTDKELVSAYSYLGLTWE